MYAEKLPPHDVEAEEAVIGSLLIDGDTINRVAGVIKPEDFFRERNRWCFDACMALYQRGDAINQVAVAHELNVHDRLDGVGGPAYLSHLVAVVPTPIHAEHYARIVNRSATMRRLIQAAGDIATIGYAGSSDVDAAIAQAEDLIYRIRSGHAVRDFVTIREVLDQYLEESIALGGPLEQGLAPIPSGFTDLDRLLGGLQRGDLLVLASRPGLGKSTLAMNIAEQLAVIKKIPVGFFSLEMSEDELNLRMLGSHSGVNTQRFVNRRDPEEKRLKQMENMAQSVAKLNAAPIHIRPRTDIDINQLRAEARRLVSANGVQLIIVDYLQLVEVRTRRNGGTRAEEVGEITRGLKKMALELDIPVIALAQLNRSIESDNSRMPRLSDLRESGSIEADSDVVAFIYCQNQAATKGGRLLSQIFVGKNRSGPQGRFDICFDRHHSRFEDWRSHRDLVEEAEKSRS